MIQLKADATIKAAFNKTINVMGADIDWLEILVVNNNSIILPGKRRSLIFSFDNRKVINTIVDIDVNVDNARLMCNNTLLENAFNILLYIFGKWNQIKGLTVGQNYKQLKTIVDNVFSEIGVTSEIAKDKCRFYKDGIQVVYEDVIQLILEKMMNISRYNSKDIEDEESEQESQEKVVDNKKKHNNKIGLWHSMTWKSDEKSFRYNGMSKKERSRKRLGRGFYASPYQCPVCGGIMYMTVYAQGQEQKIETDEGNVYLARAYTCDECTIFFTPRPDRLLAEGLIYKLDFDGDETAYNDYIDVMGKTGQRVSNCNFNVYESDYERKSDEQIRKEEEEREETDRHMLSDVCDNIQEHPDAEIFQLNARMDADFYSQKNVKKYGPAIEKETKKRNLFARDIKNFFKERFELDSRKRYGSKENKNIEQNRHDKAGESELEENEYIEQNGHEKTGEAGLQKNEQIEKNGHDKIYTGNTYDGTLDRNNEVSKVQLEKRRRDNKERLKNVLLKGDDRQFIVDTASLSPEEIKDFADDISADDEISEDMKKKYISLSEKIFNKKQEKKIAQKLLEVKDGDYNAMTQAYQQIDEEDCPDDIKQPLLKKLFSWIRTKKKKELDDIIGSVPEYFTRNKYKETRDKIYKYSDNNYMKGHNRMSDDRGDTQLRHDVEADMSINASADYKDNDEMVDAYEAVLDNKWKESQIKSIKNIINNADNSVRDIYDILSNGEFDDDILRPILEKYHDELVRQDTVTIEQLCPDLASMTFDEAAEAYQKISEQMLLPELKKEALNNIIEYLDSLKRDECISLIEKFAKDMGYDENYPGLYMYRLQKTDGAQADNEMYSGNDYDNEINNQSDFQQDISDNPYPVENALYTYCTLEQFEYPIAICDTSRSSNGKKGFVLTPDNIYYSCGMSSGVLSVRNIEDVYIDKGLLSKGIYADYAQNGRIKISSLPKLMENERLQHFVECLKEYIVYLKEKPISRSIEYLANTQREVICCLRCGYIFDAKQGDICPKCGNVNEV